MKMHNGLVRVLVVVIVAALSACAGTKGPTLSESSRETLLQKSRDSLESLYASSPEAKDLRKHALAILVFPDIVRAGLIVGGSGGNGVMFSPAGDIRGYYNASSVSFGLQAGVQDYAEALFLTTPEALKYLDSSAGWSLGVGPTVVVVDAGAARDVSTTTARSDVFAFIYGQKGLMGGVGLQGQKITKLRP